MNCTEDGQYLFGSIKGEIMFFNLKTIRPDSSIKVNCPSLKSIPLHSNSKYVFFVFSCFETVLFVIDRQTQAIRRIRLSYDYDCIVTIPILQKTTFECNLLKAQQQNQFTDLIFKTEIE